MSSEIDHPRQRTVAELLAEHGGDAATGRRRRRREAEDAAGGEPAAGSSSGSPAEGTVRALAVPATGRTALREVPPLRFAPDTDGTTALPPRPPRSAETRPVAPLRGRPLDDPARDRPTEQIPRLRDDGSSMLDPGLTGPIPVAPAAPAGRAVLDDGGPPTQAGDPLDLEDDHPAGLGAEGLREDPAPDGADDEEPQDEPADRGARDRSSVPGQMWAAVVAQWIVGAVGGAALWVGFRYLWRSLPVVALAAAVLVTIGLVVVVRALLRNDDRRTTLFAVLVGLLLTVSPALLVLLGR